MNDYEDFGQIMKTFWIEGGASSGVTRLDNWSVLMNSRISCKFMLFEVNPLGFASSDVKCLTLCQVIPAISTDEKNLGSEAIRFPYRKPTQVDRSSRPR